MAEGLTNVTFQQADIFHLPFAMESFDHLFLCFVLDHLPQRVLSSTYGYAFSVRLREKVCVE